MGSMDALYWECKDASSRCRCSAAGSGKDVDIMDVLTLPTLKIGIYDHEELIRIAELPDPRDKFCTHWNDLNPNLEARPLANLQSDLPSDG
jgi:hypothetical protein